MEEQEIIKEFLIESNENIARLEREIVELEQRPGDPELLGGIFRTFHTIKGTCGFLSFSHLEKVTHVGENLLSQIRNGRGLTPELTSLILEAVDVIKKELSHIEGDGNESGESYEDLRKRLAAACEGKPTTPAKQEESAADNSASQEESPDTEDRVSETAAGRPVSDAERTAGARAGSVAESTIRVDVGLLDTLMNLVGELVLARNQILQFNSRQDDAALNGTSQRLNLITTQLQENVMKTRMQPIGVVWNKLPRVVRDLATSCGKQVQLEMDGAETELDKSIVEAIKDPLTHIVRNCCDHGIEAPAVRARAGKPLQGKLLLRAYHEGGQVNIEIADDGGGIDPVRIRQKAVEKGLLRPEQAERISDRETLQLIFAPGFSTAEKVTSISGRGVGMDVVKTNIEKIGGAVDLASTVGVGTTVKIRIPLTLAIIPGLVINSGGERFIIPQVSLLELLRLEGEAGKKQIERIHETPVYRRRGSLLPIAYLNQVLGLPESDTDSQAINIVVLQAEDRQFGLVVDSIHDTQEIVVKPLGKQLKGLTGYAGATIMGDGRIALILDVLGIGQMSGVLSGSHEQARAQDANSEQSDHDQQTFLLFRAGEFERLAVPLSLVARLEEFAKSRIECAAGQLVVQYRDQILPLLSLSGGRNVSELPDLVQVVVFADGDRRSGLLVDQILDIQQENIRVRQQSNRPGLLGSAVISGKVTDFLDLSAILQTGDHDWLSAGKQGAARPLVVVADSSAFSRGLVRSYLDLAGYRVIEASGAQPALDAIAERPVSAVLVASDLLVNGTQHFAVRLRARPETADIPVAALFNVPEEVGLSSREGLSGCFERFDRAAVLRWLNNTLRTGCHGEQSQPAAAAPTGLAVR
jgi:two-component system chemotaxis sensor kinase CheA